MRCLLLLLPLLACASTRSQPSPRVVDFFLDPVGKFYYLLGDERLVTDNPLGQNRFEFYDSSLGVPDLVDVTNPFAILLYYETYGQLVVLDRTLSERSRLDLFGVEAVQEPAAVARGADNTVWLFDSWDYRLVSLDARGEIRHQSNDLRLELGLVDAPDRIYVDKNLLFLHFTDQGRLAVFTNYGRFREWVDLPAASRFGWHAPYLMGMGEETWRWRYGARPQVRGAVAGNPLPEVGPGKFLPTANGYYSLTPAGTAEPAAATWN